MTRRADGYWRFVATYIRENPGCTAREVADQLGCSTAYIRAVVQRRGLKVRKRRYKAPTVQRDPPRGVPVVRAMFEIADRKKVTALSLSRIAGPSQTALSRYRSGAQRMGVDTLEACLNALGYELTCTRRKSNAAPVSGR